MPTIPEIKVETSPWCNLRQALQWLKDEIKPVDVAYEPALGRSTELTEVYGGRTYDKEKSALYLAIRAGRLPLFGRPGLGKLHYDCEFGSTIYFERHGERELISPSKLDEAGFSNVDFERNCIEKITAWEHGPNGWPIEGWKDIDLVVPTEKLMRVFPADDPFPPPIELSTSNPKPLLRSPLPPPKLLSIRAAVERVALHTGASFDDSARAFHDALCARDLIAEDSTGQELECAAWRSFSKEDFIDQVVSQDPLSVMAKFGWHLDPSVLRDAVDCWLARAAEEQPTQAPPMPSRSSAADDGPTAETAASKFAGPPYIRFLNYVAGLLGATADTLKKEELEAKIEAHWPKELPVPSQKLIGVMATLLRSPEAQRGGAKPARSSTRGTQMLSERRNGSAQPTEAPAEVEAA